MSPVYQTSSPVARTASASRPSIVTTFDRLSNVSCPLTASILHFPPRLIATLTRSQPPGWLGYTRRVDAEMLAEVVPGPTERPLIYVCGPTPFVETVAEALVGLGHDPQAIKTERFGPTGG